MMFDTPYRLDILAQAKMAEYQEQAELQRLLKEVGAPLRSQLAHILQSVAVKLAPELSHLEPARSFSAPRKTSVREAR